jgi:hypothetical protein
MVVLAELDRASNLAPANLFEVKSGNAYELAGGYFRVYVGHGHISFRALGKSKIRQRFECISRVLGQVAPGHERY